jgi:hypothetical protein
MQQGYAGNHRKEEDKSSLAEGTLKNWSQRGK